MALSPGNANASKPDWSCLGTEIKEKNIKKYCRQNQVSCQGCTEESQTLRLVIH